MHGWCETVATLGRCAPGMEEVRLPNAVGGRAVDRSAPLASNHYFDAVVVPYDAAPPGVSRGTYCKFTRAAGRQPVGAAAVAAALQLQSLCSVSGRFHLVYLLT